MSYSISYGQYSPIFATEDEDIIKDTLQQMFELFVMGKRLQKSKTGLFMEKLACFIASCSIKVRKWAYHCACFYQNDAIIKKCKENLLFEEKKENILWALTVLSVRYNNRERLRQCVSDNKHEEFINTISPHYLEDVLSLFSRAGHLNIKQIFDQNNSSDLAALAKIYGYPALNQGDYPEIDAAVIAGLLGHEDAYVREYAYWSLYHGGSEKKYLLSAADMDLGVRKWQIAVQFESADTDFILAALKPLRVNAEKIEKEIKEGVLKGLGKIPYQESFVPYIFDWYISEDTELINYLLIDYMLLNCDKNQAEGTFLDVLNDVLSEGNSFSQYIQKKLTGSASCNVTLLPANKIIYNERNVFMQTVKVETNQGQINISNENSSLVAVQKNTYNADEWQNHTERILQEVRKFSPEDAASIQEELAFIKNELTQPSPKKAMIKKILDGLAAVKGSAAFAASVASLIQFVRNMI